MTRPKLVEVWWMDAQSLGGWQDRATFDPELGEAWTTGYLLDGETDGDKIVIAQSYSVSEYGNVMVIPRKLILGMTDLEISKT